MNDTGTNDTSNKTDNIASGDTTSGDTTSGDTTSGDNCTNCTGCASSPLTFPEQDKQKADMATTSLHAHIREAVVESATKHINGLDEFIASKLSNIVAQALGFNYRWGEWEVDHSNGREPMVASYISPMAQKAAQDVINDTLTVDMVADIVKRCKVGMVTEFERKLKYHFDSAIEELARERAKELAAKVIQSLDIDLGPLMNMDLCNPECGSDSLSKAILSRIIGGGDIDEQLSNWQS